MILSRFARRLLIAAAATLAGVVALAGAALVWLSSPRSERRLLGELLSRVNGEIQGKLDVADIDIHLDGSLEVRGASLFDPEGKVVARAEQTRARIELLPLLAKRVHVASVVLRGGLLSLENQSAGVNLARALAPRRPRPAGSPGSPDWTLIADRIDISELAFSYRLGPSAPALVALDRASLKARGRFGTRSELSASASGELQVPIAGPFRLEVACAGGSSSGPFEPLAIETVALEAPGTRVRVSGRLSRARLAAKVAQLVAPRVLLDALAPGQPLISDVTADGAFSVDARALEVDARVGAGGGGAKVKGRVGFSPLEVRVAARVDDVELDRLFAGMPATDLHANLDGTFSGPLPHRGHLEVTLDPSTVRGVQISSLGGSVDLEGAQATVRSLLAELPGGRIGLWGRARREALDLMASLDLQSAARFSRALGTLFGVEAPELEGHGVLSARLKGPPASPRLGLTGLLASIKLGAIEVSGVSIEGAMPNAARPFAFRATLLAKEGRFGELPFTDLDASLQAERRVFSADLATAGLAGVKAHLGGVLDADRSGGRVDRLEVAAGRERWIAAAPTRVDLRRGFRVDRLELRSGEQRLTLTGGVASGALALDLRVRKLDLAALPRLVLPAALGSRGLCGQLDLDAAVRGSVQRPEGSARLRGAHLGVGRLRDIQADVALAVDHDRFSGKANLGQGRSAGMLAADLPRALFEAPPGTPVAAHGKLGGFDLGEVVALLSPKPPLSGTADLSFELSGTVGHPEARAKVSGRRIAWATLPASEVTLQVESGATSHGVLSASLPGGPLSADVALGAGLRALLRGEKVQALLAAPLRATLGARGTRLESFAGLLFPEGIAGAASLDGRFEGTLGAPLGEAHLSVAGGVAGRFSDLGLKADLAARAGEISLDSGLRWRGASAASLTARVSRGVSQLKDRAALASAPLEAHLSLGPVDLSHALGIEGGSLEGSGTLVADLKGTLGQPVIEASGSTSALSANGQVLGRLESRGRYRGAKATLEATVLPSTGGSAAMEAEVGVDLGLGALLAGVDWDAAPLDARLRSKDLDLRVLALALPAREVRGSLTVSGEVKGRLGAPRPRGTLSLRDGQIAIPGYGTWRQVALELSGTDRRLELSDLSARAGNGTLKAQASAERTSLDEPYQLNGHLEVSNLPLTVNDRLVAFLTGSTERLTGQIQGRAIVLDAHLARTRVQLPEVIGGRELEPLEGHPDIFVRTGSGPTARQLAAAAQPPSVREGGFEMRVRLVVPNVTVQSSDLKVEAAADVSGTLASGRVELKGEALLNSGRADAMGRRFDVQRSKLSWSGDPPADPRLDLHASYDNLREQVKVKVTVSGTGQKPKIELSSEPALDEAEIATLLATGRREIKRGAAGVASGGGAASVAGNFLASRLRRVLASKLPLDVLQVEVGSDPRAQQTRLEAGTYLGDRVYLGFRRNFGADTEHHQNANEVRVEYQITPRISLESEYGDQGSGGANVVFSREY